VPVGRGRKFLSISNPFVDGVIGGWQISTINTMQAGTPFNLTYSPSSTNQVSQQISATYRGANEYRPNIVPGQKLIQNTQIPSNGFIQYVNYAAIALPPTKDGIGNTLSPFGNLGRNPGRNTAFYQTDLALNKKFSTPIESLKVEFRTEFYNILNHTNLYLPNTISGTLGTTTQTVGVGGTVPVGAITGGTPSSGGQISSTFEPRIIQFGLKILY